MVTVISAMPPLAIVLCSVGRRRRLVVARGPFVFEPALQIFLCHIFGFFPSAHGNKYLLPQNVIFGIRRTDTYELFWTSDSIRL